MTVIELSVDEWLVYTAFVNLTRRMGVYPTCVEIGATMGMNKHTVGNMLRVLSERGVLRRRRSRLHRRKFGLVSSIAVGVTP